MPLGILDKCLMTDNICWNGFMVMLCCAAQNAAIVNDTKVEQSTNKTKDRTNLFRFCFSIHSTPFVPFAFSPAVAVQYMRGCCWCLTG